ncbi:MFS transporter [Halopenitus sp. H-Gu1]|uniref:MFS transporter n=1 Tax=Halopenitus sp. H-Gu1 TaxID=3242697 RepID=UPI00359D09FE
MNWRYGHTVLTLCTLAFTATMVARLAISPVVPLIAADFGVSYATIGLALSGMWAAYALSQFPSGVLGERYGERRIILVAVGATGAAALLLAVSPTVTAFVAFTIVLGAGAGLHYSVATALLTRQFDNIGRAIGIHVTGGPVAGLLAPPVAALLGARYGWRWAMGLGALVAIPVFGLFAWRIQPTEPLRPDQPIRERFELGPLVELISRPPIAYTTALSMLGAFSWQATASFLPAFLTDAVGLSTASASLLFSLYFLIHGGTQPLIGALSDRWSRDAAATITMAAGVVGFGGLIYAAATEAGTILLVAPTVALGVAMSWGAPIQSRFMDLLEDAERGAGFGLVRTVYMVLGASGSVIVGTVSDMAGWLAAFGLLTAVMGIGLAALVINRVARLGL